MSTQKSFHADHNLIALSGQTSHAAEQWSAFAAISLGVVLVLFTLFSPISKVHNAAHDTRHAVVAPCH
jgi:cobalt transporter subunit CbtB